MRITIPDYYREFTCAAGDCPDTCCACWLIRIDDKSLNRYHRLKGPFGNRLRNSIDWERGLFHQYDGSCAMLNEENLCDIQVEAGPEAVCRTCRNYPRHQEAYENVREWSLSLSCPEAARLILSQEKPVRFLSGKTGRKETYLEFDSLLFRKLMDTRKTMIALLQNRKISGRIRMALVLGLAHDFERRYRRMELHRVDALLRRYESESACILMEQKLASIPTSERIRYEAARGLFHLIDRLEVLKPEWTEWTINCQRLLLDGGEKEYNRKQKNFQSFLDSDEKQKRLWEQWQEQLMVYFTYTYFCGSVYDGLVFAKEKLAVVSTILVQKLACAVWTETGNLRTIDMAKIAYHYSREAEHSDENLKRLDQIFQKEFKLSQLLEII